MIKKALKTILIAFFLVLAAVISYYLIFPDIAKLKKQNPLKTSFMEYREKEWGKKGKKIKIKQRWIKLSDVSTYLIKAVIIAEDDKFWSHEGFDFDAIQKALEKDIRQRRFKFGGSTISQQLVKNLYLTPEKKPIRKLKEAVITWRLEKTLSKKRIIEIYLNVVEWGDGIFGIEAASLHYYNKPASNLTAEESARLAAVLPNPRRYSPIGQSMYVEKRSKIIYSIMTKRGIVSSDYDGD
ncbi:MAG: monofunctional biosynthetic peptidoglycan transglycosylase [Nitrospirae bacterium]|nr:monofunctional biosynthetic peptidoglycan transglycosylase [Nitrospirota bacterium]